MDILMFINEIIVTKNISFSIIFLKLQLSLAVVFKQTRFQMSQLKIYLNGKRNQINIENFNFISQLMEFLN